MPLTSFVQLKLIINMSGQAKDNIFSTFNRVSSTRSLLDFPQEDFLVMYLFLTDHFVSDHKFLSVQTMNTNGAQQNFGHSHALSASAATGTHGLSTGVQGDFGNPFSSTHGLSTNFASLNHPHNDTWDVLDSISKADHKTLILSGNTTYQTLVVELGGLRARLETVE